MSSSKFSSPFFKKSPLQGAYSSGAGGMVTVSYDDVHQKFQDGIAANVAKAYAPKTNSCSNLEQKLSEGTIKEGAYKVLKAKCAEQSNDDKDSDNTGSFENVTGKKPFEGQMTSLSDYKKSNKTNPYYMGKGYESPYTTRFDVELPDLG
jgi:hypothetical protein